MGSKWINSTLGEIALGSNGAVDGPFGSNLPASAYVENGYPVIRGSNLSVGLDEFKDQDFVYVPEDVFQRLSRSECVAGDIIFTKKGTLGQTGLICPHHRFDSYLLSSNQMRLRVDTKKALPEYVYYWVSSQKAINKLLKDSECTGVPKINLAYLKSFPITLPSLVTQRNIIDVLGVINNKITLNRQINQTLEQMAQALFKSWFVDFDPVIDNALDAGFFEQNSDLAEALLRRAEQRKAVREQPDFKPLPAETRQLFPAAFEECEEPSLGLGGWVPKGWACSPLNAFINLIGGGTPKTSEESFWGGDIPWFSVVDAPNDSDVFVLKTEKYITEAGLSNSSAKLLRVGTTIISARGTVGKCALVGTPMAMNQSCYGINGIDGVADNFVYFMVRHLVSQLRQRSHGSVFSTITRDTFNSLKFIFPNVSLNDAFKDQTANWFERIHINNRQLFILQDLRDTLLPKLISGELRLNDDGTLASGNTDC